MAVYSPIEKKELYDFLKDYQIGELESFEGILEGIENTNYKIKTSKNLFILTIFEKRVEAKDLPFFISLKNHLAKKKFLCPQPISNIQGKNINLINNKSCVLVSFLKGKKTEQPSEDQCKQIGKMLATFHLNAMDFGKKRENTMGYNQWINIFNQCKKTKNVNYKKYLELIEIELSFLKQKWPADIPKGVIHADVFQDNVFFYDNKFSGLIDFYFACNDYFAYDIALTINAWCFNKKQIFKINLFHSFLEGYGKVRKLEYKEKIHLNTLLRGASIRILLTRLFDILNHDENAFVKPKDPGEYLSILKYHTKNNIIKFLS